MNKSFAEERNIDFCPALNLASVFVFGHGGSIPGPGSLVVQRSDENGGSKTYGSMDGLVSDYQDGSLHPGDLKKHAMISVVMNVLDKVSRQIQNDPDAKQATKTLKAALKKKK
jgi:hypothetical protein